MDQWGGDRWLQHHGHKRLGRTILRVEVEEKKKTSCLMKEAWGTSQSSRTETVVSLMEHEPWDDCREKVNLLMSHTHILFTSHTSFSFLKTTENRKRKNRQF